MLAGRRVLVGVTGGIAAFKAAELVSALVKAGAEVRVVMTRAAREFVGPTTFRALTGYPVATDLWSQEADDHIALARWAELVVVAPVTAHTLARYANGLADDLLSTLLLASRAPLVLAPAMNTNMLTHPAVQANLARVAALGAEVILGAPGRLACGTEGPGRMAEPEELLAAVERRLARTRDLEGKRLLIAAGRTEEPLDPVRYISNRSSGKTGAALAREALERGAQVTLVWGPADVEAPAGVDLQRVGTAAEMEAAMQDALAAADVVIMAAAVADYRPSRAATHKIRRTPGQELSLDLEPTADILAGLGRAPERASKLLIGYALETGAGPEAARSKLREKGLDLLVWNDPTRPDCGFGSDRNQVAFLDPEGGLEELPLLTKAEIARRLLDRVAGHLQGSPGTIGAEG